MEKNSKSKIISKPILRNLLIAFSVCLNFNVQAQAPPWMWARAASSVNAELAYDVAVNSAGDVFATGVYAGALNGATAFNSATFTATNGGTEIGRAHV